MSWDAVGYLKCLTSILILLCTVSISDLFLNVTKGDFLAIDKDTRKLTPLSLGQFLASLDISNVINFVGEVEHQIYNA